VFKSVPGCIEGIPGHYGMLRGIMGCSRGVPGLFRAVPGCAGLCRAVPVVFRGCSGVFRGVPGFTDTPIQLRAEDVCQMKDDGPLHPKIS